MNPPSFATAGELPCAMAPRMVVAARARSSVRGEAAPAAVLERYFVMLSVFLKSVGRGGREGRGPACVCPTSQGRCQKSGQPAGWVGSALKSCLLRVRELKEGLASFAAQGCELD